MINEQERLRLMGEGVRRLYEEKQEYIRGIKAALGCQNCGINDFRVLHMHHRDPAEKNEKLRRGRSLPELSWKDLRVEVTKCEVLCANCHAIETWHS